MAESPGAVTHAAAGTVRLPLLGTVNKKTLAIAALVGGGVLAYVWVRRAHGASGIGPSATASTGTDPNLDPATGFDYGTPQDIAALNANAGSPGLGFGSGLGLGNGGPGGGEFFNPNTTTTATVTTNAEWEQEAIANLQDGGVSEATVRDAESGLPRYLAHLTLGPGQATAVQLAVGLTGKPPVGGPFAIRRAPAPHPPPKTGKVKVPGVTGDAYAVAERKLTAAGLKTRRSQPFIGIVGHTSPAEGTEVSHGSTVTVFPAGVTPPNPPRPH